MGAKRKSNPGQDDLFGGPDEEVPPDPFAASTPPPKPRKRPRADPSLGDALRDAGIDQAIEGDEEFHQHGLECIRKIFRGWEGTAEAWRMPMEHDGWHPRSYHGWGALSGAAKRLGLIIPTGRMEKPKDPTSHSREIKVWRRL